MNSIKELAAHYLRRWVVNLDHSMKLADNAPGELRVLVREMAPEYSPSEVFAALEQLATGKPTRVPALPGLLTWLSVGYDAVTYCQDAFANKRTPPKSFEDLLERAYKASQNNAVSRVHAFLNTQLSSF